MTAEPRVQDKPKYGGQTSCGYPFCAPDPPLVRKLDAHEDLLAALEECVALLAIGAATPPVAIMENARNAIRAAKERT